MGAIADPETLADLISDCADLPDAVLHPKPPVGVQERACEWRVSDECLAAVDGIDDYGG